jgi:hypothetical protein
MFSGIALAGGRKVLLSEEKYRRWICDVPARRLLADHEN